MIDNEKLEIFGKHLSMVHAKTVKNFTEFCILKFPSYFWTLPASTRGCRHGAGETLIDHIQGCLWLAERVIDQFSGVWNQRQKDQLLSAVILHDGWRCEDALGQETIFTEEYLKGKDMSLELLGQPCTSKEHPEAAFRNLLRLSAEFNAKAVADKSQLIAGKDLSAILNAVRMHFGPWTTGNGGDGKFSLDYPFSSLTIQLHNIDYMNCLCSQYFTRVKGVGDVSNSEVQKAGPKS